MTPITCSIFKIMNQCEIHLSSQFSNFQKSKIQVEKVLDNAIDGLNRYWDKLEEIGAGLVMGVKSKKELQLEILIAKSQQKAQQNNSKYSYEDIQQPSRINYPYFPHNPSLTVDNKQSKPKPASLPSKLGQMSNKRKGKQSILQSSDKKIMRLITNWYVGVDKEQKYLLAEDLKNRSDVWKEVYQMKEGSGNRRAGREENNYSNEGFMSQYYSHHHTSENHAPGSLQQLLTLTYPTTSDIQSLYYYDQNSPSPFSLQHPISNLLQSRLIFQAWHHTKLESQFNKISQLLSENQKKVYKLQQKQKKQSDRYGIGFRNADRGEERKLLEKFVREGFDEEFLPQAIMGNIQREEEIDQEDDREGRFKENYGNEMIDKSKVYEKLAQFNIISASKEKQKKLNIDGSSKRQKLRDNSKPQPAVLTQSSTSNKPEPIQNSSAQSNKLQSLIQTQTKLTTLSPLQPTHQPTLLSSLIQSYFVNIQTKYSRLAVNQKMHKTYYFPSLDSTLWQFVCLKFHKVQRVFIVLQQPGIFLVRMEKLYNMQKEMIKCVVYMFDQQMKEVDKQFLKKKLGLALNQEYMVTFSFKVIKTSQQSGISNTSQVLIFYKSKPQPKTIKPSIMRLLPCPNLPQVQCLMGMLTVLIYQQKIQQSSYQMSDFLFKGQQLIKQYELYFLQDNQNLVQSFHQFIKFDHSYYQKMAKINYVFDLQGNEGLTFDKLSNAAISKRQQVKVEVFRARAKNYNKKSKFDQDQQQEVAEEDDQDQDSDDEDEGNYGRPMFVPINRGGDDSGEDEQENLDREKGNKQNEKRTLQKDIEVKNGNSKHNRNTKKASESQLKQKQVRQKKPLLSDNQLKPTQLLLDSHKPILNQNKDGMKRSNSREELKHMGANDLLVDNNYERYEMKLGEEDNKVEGQEMQREGEVDGGDKEERREQIDEYYEEEHDVVGL